MAEAVVHACESSAWLAGSRGLPIDQFGFKKDIEKSALEFKLKEESPDPRRQRRLSVN